MSAEDDRAASGAEASTSSSPAAPASGAQQSGAASGSGPKKKKDYQPLAIPSGEQIIMQDVMDNCFVKSAMSGAMGGVAGLAFGLFTASMENSHGGMDTLPTDHQNKPTRVVLKEMFQNMKTKSVSYAKGFAMMGALYSFNECVIEKYRAKHDKMNPALAGCVTGAMLAHNGGPQAMCFGCASFAAFSTAIEYFLES